VRDLVAAHPAAGVSLVDGVLVLRALAAQGESIRNLFMSVWRALRPGIIGREAVPPRIWAT
jgi:urease accessory protein